ncbi:MAG: ABC transporter substrate-binding protein [Dehalococcoidia bacterium]
MERSYWTKTLAERTLSRRKALAMGAAGLSSAAFLAACGGSDDDGGDSSTPGASAESGTPQRGGKFATISNGVTNENPVSNYSGGYSLAGDKVYDRLLTSTTTTEGYRLEAAEKVEIPDPQQIVFTLKAGMVYQNVAPVSGRAVKASDVVATQQYVLQLPNAYDKSFQRDVVQSVTAPDEKTVVFKLKQPDAYAFGGSKLGLQTSQAIIPPELYDNLDAGKPVGSGPYQLSDSTPNVKYVFRRFDGYRGASKNMPYVDEKEMQILTDVVAIETALRAGQLQYWNTAPLPRIDSIVSESGGKIKQISVKGLGFWGLHMNMERNFPWQKDDRVRQAMYRVVNRQQILDLVFASKGVLPPALLQAGLANYQLSAKDTEQYYKQDLAEGKRLLAAAGWDANREVQLTTRPDGLNSQAAEVIAQQFATLGIKNRVVPVAGGAWLSETMARGEYEMNISSSPGGDTPYMTIRYLHSDQKTQFNHFGLKDPAIDALIEKSEVTVDRDDNIKLVKQIQLEGLKKYGSVLNLVTQDVVSLLDAKVQGFVLPPSTNNVDAGYQDGMWIKQS